MATSTTKKAKTNEERAQAMLLWARKNRFAVHGVTVGDVVLTCTDLGPPPTSGRKGAARPAEKSVYAEYGGDAWEKAQAESGERDSDDPDDDPDDDDPPGVTR